MLVSCVHPVAILRAVFCIICSLSMFVSDALGDHMVEAYSSTGLIMALYVSINVCVYCVECYCDGACGWNELVETCCDSVVDVVECCVCGVFGFEPVLCCDVWYILCYVRKNHLLKCLRLPIEGISAGMTSQC